ncbi:MAG: hypothetical protein SGPRY_008528, partial [Prymnesium sp.]
CNIDTYLPTAMLLPPLSLAASLQEQSLASSAVLSLDSGGGVAWTALRSGGAPLGCAFTPNTDLNHTADTLSEHTHVATAEECCSLCWSETLCSASVFSLRQRTCSLKRALNSHGVPRPAHTLCVRRRGAASPLAVKARVPGDLISDLQRAGEIADPLFEANFLNDSLYHQYNWTYTTSFHLLASHLAAVQSGGRVQLVFEGIKMGGVVAHLAALPRLAQRPVLALSSRLRQRRAGGSGNRPVREVSVHTDPSCSPTAR